MTSEVDQTTINYSQALNLALHDALEVDQRVFLMGEDIADEEDGGVRKATAGLSTKFGTSRVRSTPIMEEGFVAAGIGAAVAGMLPVVEVMIMGFIGLALDVIHNHAAKWRYMTGGTSHVPITIRTNGGHAGGGIPGQHGDMLESWFLQSPGLKVVVPSNAEDTYGLLTSCIFDDDPCLFIEPALLFRKQPKCIRPAPGKRTRIGSATVSRTGSDVSVISYGGQILDAIDVAGKLSEEGVEVEVVDLRTLCPLDMPTVLESVAKTRRAVIVHEARTNYGPGAEVATRIYEELLGDLEAPIQRVGGENTTIPGSERLSQAWLPNAGRIEAGIRLALDGRGVREL